MVVECVFGYVCFVGDGVDGDVVIVMFDEGGEGVF